MAQQSGLVYNLLYHMSTLNFIETLLIQILRTYKHISTLPIIVSHRVNFNGKTFKYAVLLFVSSNTKMKELGLFVF